MKKIFQLILLNMVLMGANYSYAQEIPFTKDDRARLIRLETKVEEGQKAINQRFEGVNKRFDDVNKRIDDLREEMHALRTFMLWGFGILFGGMGILITVVIWDRRTALSPVIRRSRELEEREEKLERVLREYAKVEPKFADVLKSIGF